MPIRVCIIDDDARLRRIFTSWLRRAADVQVAGEYPDVVIGCVGGGSNFAGIAFPFLRENLKNGQRTRLLAVEPTATPSLTKGVYTFDYGDTAKMAPIVKMHTLGHDFNPPCIHAGGLRYHGMAPTISAIYDAGHIEAVAVKQLATFRRQRAARFAARPSPARRRCGPFVSTHSRTGCNGHRTGTSARPPRNGQCCNTSCRPDR